MKEWKYVLLKLDQVSVGSSVLDTRELPEEKPKRNCCLEAAEKYENKKEELYGPYKDINYPEALKDDVIQSWCRTAMTEELLRTILCVDPVNPARGSRLRLLDEYGKKLCQEWEECEGE